MIVVIDGPAGTGKTTVAQRVAEKLGFHYFDTGAMYRAVTYMLKKQGISLENAGALDAFLHQFHFEIRDGRYFAGDEDVTEEIRSGEVTSAVSAVSAEPKVRQTLVRIQQEFGKQGNAVFEGRDMGTVVFPDAAVKVFLTARPAVRAERRYRELKEKSTKISEEKVLEQLMARDHLDSTREMSPLRQAENAELIDTSDLTIDQVVDQIVALISRKKP